MPILSKVRLRCNTSSSHKDAQHGLQAASIQRRILGFEEQGT